MADIYSPAVTDSPALQEARVKIVAYLNDILDGQLDETSSTSTGSTSSQIKNEIGNLGNVETDISKEQTNVASSIVSLPELKLIQNSPAPQQQDQGLLPQLKSFTFGLNDAIMGDNQENRESGLLGDLNLGNIFESPNEQTPNDYTPPQQQQFSLPMLQTPQIPQLPQTPQKPQPPSTAPAQSNTIVPPTSYTPPTTTQSTQSTPNPSSSPKTNSTLSGSTSPKPKPILSFTLSVLSANTLSQSSATSSSSTPVNATPIAVTPSESEFYNQNMDQDPGVLTPDRDSNNIAAENAKINAILHPKKPVKPLDMTNLEGKDSLTILNLIRIHGKKQQQPKIHKKHHHTVVNTNNNVTMINNDIHTITNTNKKISTFTENNNPLGNLPNFPVTNAPGFGISNGAHKIIIESHSTTYPQLAFAKNDAFSVESTDLSNVQLPSFISSSNFRNTMASPI